VAKSDICFSIKQRVLGAEHCDVATLLNNIAELMQDQGRCVGAWVRVRVRVRVGVGVGVRVRVRVASRAAAVRCGAGSVRPAEGVQRIRWGSIG
jgi:hypothetical protein